MRVGNKSSLNQESLLGDPYTKMSPQDALVTVALYACLNNRNWINCHEKIDKILDLSEKSRYFSEETEDILSRIYRAINLFRWEDPDLLIGLAAASLTPDLRKVAFDWALEMAADNSSSSKEIKGILRRLAQVLAVEERKINKKSDGVHFVQQVHENARGCTR